jgi:hypothetical protein
LVCAPKAESVYVEVNEDMATYYIFLAELGFATLDAGGDSGG